MATVRLNVAANFAGRIWTTALAFLFIPLYLKLLGIEAYGLIGFFSTLQAVLGLLDLGLSTTVNREMARLSAAGRREAQRDLLRTLEIVYWGMSAVIGLLIVGLAPLLATRWISAQHLSPDEITRAVRLMGVVIALQFPWGFYQGAMMGLERQLYINVAQMVFGTARTAGVALLLWQVSASLDVFFGWQVVISIVQTAWFGIAVWSWLPGKRPPRFSMPLLQTVWEFAATIAANSLIGTVLTQLDKVILSSLLTLEQFGYYALAGTIGSIVWIAIVPINQALFPRFTQLLARGEVEALATVYHRAAQALTVVIVPMSATIAFFAWGLIATWTDSPLTADHTALVVRLLIIGTTLNGLASLASHLQAAAGWPQLVMYTNLASAALLVPLMVAAASRFGPAGAAAVWIVLNSGYLLVTIPIMHRRLLRGELVRWYRDDVTIPAVAALAAVGVIRWLVPVGTSGVLLVAGAGAAWLLAVVAAAAVAPLVRTAALLVLADRPWLHLSWSRS